MLFTVADLLCKSNTLCSVLSEKKIINLFINDNQMARSLLQECIGHISQHLNWMEF